MSFLPAISKLFLNFFQNLLQFTYIKTINNRRHILPSPPKRKVIDENSQPSSSANNAAATPPTTQNWRPEEEMWGAGRNRGVQKAIAWKQVLGPNFSDRFRVLAATTSYGQPCSCAARGACTQAPRIKICRFNQQMVLG